MFALPNSELERWIAVARQAETYQDVLTREKTGIVDAQRWQHESRVSPAS